MNFYSWEKNIKDIKWKIQILQKLIVHILKKKMQKKNLSKNLYYN